MVSMSLEKNDLYVADYYGNRAQRFRNGSRIRTTAAGDGISGSSSTKFANPVSIYVADFNNDRVQFWAQNATHVITVVGT